jgi:hypothetical protein
MEIALSVALGIGLSAACGFRIFVPFTIMSLAALSGHLTLTEGWQWIGSYPALVVFATATGLEIAAYYIPWLDNLLDSIATPAAIVAGSVAAAAAITGMSPMLTWVVAIIAGGGAAAGVQGATVLARGASSVMTMGVGNPVVATGELAGSIMTALAAIAVPLITLLGLGVVAIVVVRKLSVRQHRPIRA